MVQQRGGQLPKKDQPAKKDPAPPVKATTLLDGVKNTTTLDNTDPYLSIQRFLKQEAVAMDGIKLGFKYGDKETPPSEWYDTLIDGIRKNSIKRAEDKGVTGDDAEKLKAGMKIPTVEKNPDLLKLFEKYDMKEKGWTYKPVVMESLRKDGGAVPVTQQEILDLTKLVRMDIRTKGAVLLPSPSKLQAGNEVNKFLDDVLEASKLPANKTKDLATIYQEKKTALVTRVEKNMDKLKDDLKTEKGESIDFDKYKTERKDREGKTINGKDGKPIKDYDPKKIILLSMNDAPGADDGVKTVTLPKGAIDALDLVKSGASTLLAASTEAAMPGKEASKMLQDKDTGKGGNSVA